MNEAHKLLELIVNIAIQQDEIGYIYNKLSNYLHIFSANSLHLYLESQIFFSQIPIEFYTEYQQEKPSRIFPWTLDDSAYSLPELQEKFKHIEEVSVNKYDKEYAVIRHLKLDQVPTEFYAINMGALMADN